MKRLISMLVLTALCAASLIAQEDGRPVRRVALLVGSNAGGKNRSALKYAEKDARSMSAVLRELGGLAPRDEHLLFAPDRKALLAELASVKRSCAAEPLAGPRTEFVFYYSGHSDEEGLFLGNEKVAYADLKGLIGDVGAEVNVVILDSCASGAFTRLKGGTKAPPFLVDESSSMKGHAYLTSSSEFEATQESDKIQGSFFTYYLVAGLRGAADTSGDGRITLNEAYSHAFAETLSRTESTIAGPQHPSYNITLTGSGDLVLTDMRAAETKIVFDQAIRGRILVRDRAENLVAETIKNTDKAMEFSLPAGSYSVTLLSEGRLMRTQVQLQGGRSERVGIAMMTPVGLEKTSGRGTEGEDEKPIRIDPLSLSLLSIGPEIDELRIGHRLAFNLIGGKSYTIQGVQLSLAFGWVTTDVRGAQIAVGFNYAGGRVSGVQVASGVNFAMSDFSGCQVSQINIAGGKFSGVQVGNVNYAGAFDGTQVGNLNLAGAMSGTEVGTLNIVGSISGPQIGVLNIAGKTTGAQVGVLNIGGEAHGVQVGVLNVFGSNDGLPIGLVNVVLTGGQTHLMTWFDEKRYVTAALIHGTRRFYNIYGVGTNVDDGAKVIELGLGCGGGVGDFTLNGELVGAFYSPELSWDWNSATEPDYAVKARAYLGLRFAEHFSLIAGASYSLSLSTKGLGSSAWTNLGWQSLAKMPGWFVGIRL